MAIDNDTNNKKRRRIDQTNLVRFSDLRDCSNLNSDVLELIMKNLPFADLVRSSAVCSTWRSSARGFNAVSRPILLTVPIDQTECTENFSSLDVFSEQAALALGSNELVLANLFHKQEEESSFFCIGSSRSMLVLLDEKSRSSPVILDPFSRQLIRFPEIKDLRNSIRSDIKSIVMRTAKGESVLVIMHRQKPFSPSKRIDYCGVGSSSWAPLLLNNPSVDYQDMIASSSGQGGRGTMLYALTWWGSVEAWSFDEEGGPGSRVGTYHFVPEEALPRVLVRGCTESKFSERHYLVESSGELFLVRRFVGDFVNGRGELLEEDDMMTEESTHPLVCPYSTVEFEVYRACLGGRKVWEKVEGIGADKAFFIGGNESVSVSTKEFSGCQPNSIYFLDDNWDAMFCDYLFGGHDMGVYSMDQKLVTPFREFDHDKFNPPPFWLFPNPL